MLVAKENFVLFTPMLHEVAGADVSVTDIVQPLRKMLRRSRVAIAEIEAINLEKKLVRVRHPSLSTPYDLRYDQLVLAVGSITNFFHIAGLEEHALTMKSLGDAILVRNRLIDTLGLADNQSQQTERQKSLTVVVAGAGFAGIETAGAVNDLLSEAIKFYPHLKHEKPRVVVVHPGDVILPELSESLGRYAQKKLARRGVEILLKMKVANFDGDEVTLSDGAKIATRLLIWTAGTSAPPLLSNLPCKLPRGRVLVNECMQVPDWPGVWALGDCALIPDPYHPGKFYPPTAQHATRQAIVLADNIAATLGGGAPRPFKFKVLGMLATIGRRNAVAEVLGLRFSGIIAWWMWRSIYLSKLPGVQKKVRVAIDWFLDLIFSKDLVELPTLRSPTISETEQPAGEAMQQQAPIV